VKGARTSIRALSWQFAPPPVIMAVAFSLLYLGLCRALSLVTMSRRREADKDVELVVLRHQVRVLER
jgi:hypothetical protein